MSDSNFRYFKLSQLRTVFLAGIEKIHVDGDLGEGIYLTDSLRLTNNAEVYKEVIPPGAEYSMGAIEWSEMLNLGMLAYNHRLPSLYASNQQVIADVNENVFRLRHWFRALWLVRDNAVHTEMGYVIHYAAPHPTGARGSRNFFSHVFTRHDGRLEPTVFTVEEIRKAVTLFRAFGFGHFPQEAARDTGRIWRSFYFIESARASNDLAVRVASYMTAFESLFTTNRKRITDSLATRIACFLEPRSNRSSLAKAIRNAYDIRCEAVHGDPVFTQESLQSGDIMGKVERLKAASALCDDLLRRCVLKILARPDLFWLFMATEQRLEATKAEFDAFMLEADLNDEPV